MSGLTGQIGLIPHPGSWIAKAICWFTKSDVFHVVIALDDKTCIGAQPNGVTITPMSAWPTAIWSRFPLTEAQAKGCADWARAREHRPYNFVADAIIGIECRTGVRFPRWITRHFSSDATYECAELADAALTLGAGIQVFTDGRDFGLVYPGSFQQLFKDRGWWPPQ
ncbi:hypothetical protein [Arthrobacter sp. efr-133-TYG-118]|uniref:hypothetical protein n=1 Tax=Arthrobacter sp. efr-133-TYG-118 TaxID=3040279 RepID=UPI002551733B|nr:hypothetical protein [Arthrobacter sp. efr-133-TYG-118]